MLKIIGNNKMKIIVISEEEKYDEKKIERDLHVNRSDIIRIDPVFTDEKCIGTRGETGCFKAHQKAWETCSMQDGDQCMVLERDWTIGNLDPSYVHKRIKNAAKNKNDYHLLGHCGGYACTHAYIINKDFAGKMAQMNVCDAKKPIDLYMESKCNSKEFSCGKESHRTMPGCYGSGVIQQNRNMEGGMHDKHNNISEEFK